MVPDRFHDQPKNHHAVSLPIGGGKKLHCCVRREGVDDRKWRDSRSGRYQRAHKKVRPSPVRGFDSTG